ncbi:MAG: sterol desaturase family protein [Planctomyces sp.]|nr:sterol desaturase family protein [Planctomyces sp.]
METPEDPRPRGAHISLQSTQSRDFGHGWISGAASVALGALGLGAVLCFHYPDVLTMPELRRLYPIAVVRALLHLVLVAAYLLGVLSVCLRSNKALGLTGMALTLIAALLGGSQVRIGDASGTGGILGLDWFLLNMILYSAIYIPLERLFGLHRDQAVFRPSWRTDLSYFFVNSLLIQITTLMTLTPAMTLFDWARLPVVTRIAESLPVLVQVPLVLLVADFTQYWVHRAFHVFPVLWRFHAVHHSAEAMDWLAGSRLHVVDAVATRALTYVPIYVLGFSRTALAVYVVIVAVQATFIHANVRWTFRPLRKLIATPAFHHWHHSADRAAVDKNFAVHTPVWDRLFGTYFLPDAWPAAYGLAGGRRMPEGWLRQFLHPFRRAQRDGVTGAATPPPTADTPSPATGPEEV